MTAESAQPANDPELDPNAPRDDAPVPTPPARLGAIAGLAAAVAAVGTGLLVASLLDTVSPTDAVGSEFIDHTPTWLRELAIDWFGTSDKRALRAGMYAVMATLAVALGRVALRRRVAGAAGFAAFGVAGAVVAAQRPDTTARVVVAPLAAAAVGALVVTRLVGRLAGRWHADRTPTRSRVPLGVDRRRLLAGAGAAAGAGVAAGGVAHLLERRRLDDLRADAAAALAPSAASAVTAGEELNPVTPFITPNDDFYRIDTALSFPRIDLDRWRLRVRGRVDRALELSFDQLLARPQVERTVTLCCVSNEVGGDLVGNAVWRGVLLADLLREAGVQAGAEQVFSTSLDGWTCGFPASVALDGRDALVAIAMNGEPLPIAHGFPARLVVPGLYGYVSATKWLADIELTTWDAAEGYWIPRGWAREAPVKTQSRIDVPRRGAEVTAGSVVVAGVAWAQHRGIAAVEVRVDDGPWSVAQLSADGGDDAWRQWRWVWDATPGRHTLSVRAIDNTGEVQTDIVRSPAPDGATGHHTRTVKVVS